MKRIQTLQMFHLGRIFVKDASERKSNYERIHTRFENKSRLNASFVSLGTRSLLAFRTQMKRVSDAFWGKKYLHGYSFPKVKVESVFDKTFSPKKFKSINQLNFTAT